MNDRQADGLRWLRIFVGLAICLGFGFMQWRADPTDGLSTADRFLYDARLRVAPAADKPPVIIVDIDEASLAATPGCRVGDQYSGQG